MYQTFLAEVPGITLVFWIVQTGLRCVARSLHVLLLLSFIPLSPRRPLSYLVHAPMRNVDSRDTFSAVLQSWRNAESSESVCHPPQIPRERKENSWRASHAATHLLGPGKSTLGGWGTVKA